MFIAITTTSILAITGFVWLLNRILLLRFRSGQAFKICPICAGVFGTWLWMLAAKFIGYEIDLVILAMLMGGSVVGIAYQIEKRPAFAKAAAGKLLLWKTLFIPAGFAAAYSIISLAVSPSNLSWWIVFFVTIIFLAILVLRFAEKPRSRVTKKDKAVEELEKKMKKCC